MVVSCPHQVPTVVMIVVTNIAKLSDGSTTTMMLAVEGLDEPASASTTQSAYMQGTTLPLFVAMNLGLQDLLTGNCHHRAWALMRAVFPGDPMVGKMTAWWITNSAWRRTPPPPGNKAALEGWINNLTHEADDKNYPYCCTHDVKEDRSCVVVCVCTPNKGLPSLGNTCRHFIAQHYTYCYRYYLNVVK